MTTDTALAIALLPRLHKTGIATDLHNEYPKGPNPSWYLGDMAFDRDGDKDASFITDAQAIAYIVGAIHERLWFVTRGMPAKEMAEPLRMDYDNSPLSASVILAEHYGLIERTTT